MAEVYFRKTLTGIEPSDDEGWDALKRFALGEEMRVTLVKPRNPKFHKKGMALLRVGFANQDSADTFEGFRKAVIISAGFFTPVTLPDGSVELNADSLSFGKMDEIEFTKVYSNMIDVILKHYLVGTKEAELDEAVRSIVGFS